MAHPEVCVVYVVSEAEDAAAGTAVLLGRKRTGLGLGKIVAPGGKLEPGESPLEAAAREVHEEVGLVVSVDDLEPRGRLDYRFPAKPEWDQVSWVFVCRTWTGTVTASVELAAEWLPIEDVPLDEMWDDARWWLPEVLAGGRVDARFTFADDLSTVADSDHPAWRPG